MARIPLFGDQMKPFSAAEKVVETGAARGQLFVYFCMVERNQGVIGNVSVDIGNAAAPPISGGPMICYPEHLS